MVVKMRRKKKYTPQRKRVRLSQFSPLKGGGTRLIYSSLFLLRILMGLLSMSE